MGKLLPVILVLIGTVGGGGAGYVLRPPPVEQATSEGDAAHEADEHGDDSHGDGKKDDGHSKDGEDADLPAYVKLNNQFIVPVVYQDEVSALVVLSLAQNPRHSAAGVVQPRLFWRV